MKGHLVAFKQERFMRVFQVWGFMLENVYITILKVLKLLVNYKIIINRTVVYY